MLYLEGIQKQILRKMENNRRYKGDEGLVPRDFRSGRERRRERREQERKARWLEYQKLESFYAGKNVKSYMGKKKMSKNNIKL